MTIHTCESSRRVAGKVAVVTGAGSGLGRAISIRLAEEGAAVVGLDVDQAGLNITRELIAKISDAGALSCFLGDLTEESCVRDLFERIRNEVGSVDILVNNVGGGHCGHAWDAKVEDWDATLRLNLRPTFLCTREVLPAMMERRSGRIIAMSSAAREGSPWMSYEYGNSAYSTSKAAVHGFVRAVSMEVAAYGITVNAVAPGPILTDKMEAYFARAEETAHAPTRYTPMRRLGAPSEVAGAVLYLASDDASYVTGTTLNVAGGR